MDPVAHLRVDADTLVSAGPVLFWGYAAVVGAAEATLTLRDGPNASAPISLDVGLLATGNAALSLTRPLFFRLGLFVDFDANLTSITIFFEPLREEQLVPRPEPPVPTE